MLKTKYSTWGDWPSGVKVLQSYQKDSDSNPRDLTRFRDPTSLRGFH